MKKLILLPLVLLVLSGASCQKHIEFARPPADKLTCPNEPFAPEGEITDEKNADYLKALRAAWHGCFSDVAWMRDWFDKLK